MERRDYAPDRRHDLPLPNLHLVDGTLIQDNWWNFQLDFLDCEAKFVCMGGAYGAGKSLVVLYRLIEELWSYPDNFGLIMRKDLPRLKRSQEKDFVQLVPQWMMIEMIRSMR